MRSCYLISVTGLPAMSIPCGFTEQGLPVGLQLVGPPAGDLKLLRIAAAIEHAHPLWRRSPPL
jgi:amidase